MKTIGLSGWNDVNILNYEKSREIETCSLKLEFKLICKLKDSHVEIDPAVNKNLFGLSLK